MRPFKRSSLFYSLVVLAFMAIGLGPVMFNLVVDPFRMHRIVDWQFDPEISVKAHYPLWKMIEYPRIGGDVIVLGDSRARALQNKYWKELGVDGVYNFAYGGATIQEISDTFEYLKTNDQLTHLVVGLPLRSFDLKHRGGLNRVPEAIRLANNPLAYYSNWFVSKVSWRNLESRYRDQLAAIRRFIPSIISSAHAAEAKSKRTLSDLLDDELCGTCELPDVPTAPLELDPLHHSGYLGLSAPWAGVWALPPLAIQLTGLFERQTRKNASNDWRQFEFSETLFEQIERLAHWCQENNVRLVFVIPATIAHMQHRISEFGLTHQNHEFRARLSRLAPVIDFDYDNTFTRNTEFFKDAYHFNASAARDMVREIAEALELSTRKPEARWRGLDLIDCPKSRLDALTFVEIEALLMTEGANCRVWRQAHVE